MALTKKGKIGTIILVVLLALGGIWGWKILNPPKAKNVEVKTKATSMPPLAYDKNSNAPFRELPDYGNFASVETPRIPLHLMEWWAQAGLLNSVGGKNTTVGSICEELKVNVALEVQNSCVKQAEDLYAFAEELHSGNASPSKGAVGTIWMGDAVAAYITGLNTRLKKDFGPEYIAKVYTFAGASNGEDKWLLKRKFLKDARGSLTCTVLRDGDWNICIIKSQLMGWNVNYQDGTYDPTKVNFYPAPNDDYLEAAKFYASGQKVTLKLIRNGILTGKDTTLSCTGVSTWFPGDLNAITQKGGLGVVASTKDFGGQMASALVMISKWVEDNKEAVTNLIAAIGLGGDQVKSHMSALEYSAKVGKEVFASSMFEEDIVKAYSSYDVIDDDGESVNVGGSRVFNLADAANYAGVTGGQDKYKLVYNTFGAILTEAYPELFTTYESYDEATDWTYLRAAYNKYKSKAGNVSTTDFKHASKSGEVIGDASYSIEFNTGSAVIKPSSYSVLDKILAQLNIADNSFVDLSGHTDNTGSDELNIPLSKARAEAVRQYLLEKDGELSDRISPAKGFGSTKPLADNTTVEGKTKNRRVEVKLTRSK